MTIIAIAALIVAMLMAGVLILDSISQEYMFHYMVDDDGGVSDNDPL